MTILTRSVGSLSVREALTFPGHWHNRCLANYSHHAERILVPLGMKWACTCTGDGDVLVLVIVPVLCCVAVHGVV